MGTRNHVKDDIMSVWLRIGASLSVLITLSAIIGSVVLVKFRVDVLERDVGDLKAEFRRMQNILIDLDKTVSMGFEGLRAKIDVMVLGVESANRTALRAESRVIDSKVDEDFRSSVQPQQQPMKGKP